jgi:hypothetical protein
VPSLVRRWGGAALASTAMTSPAAAESFPEPTKHSTDLGSLIELRDDYLKSGKAMTNALVLRGDYAPERWLSLRVDVPFTYVDKPRIRPTFGLGDVYVRGTARLVASDVSLLAGSDLFLDTASSSALGGGKNVIAPFATASWDLGPGVWMRLQVQEFASIGGDPRRAPVSATSLRPYAFIALPEGCWMMLDQTIRFDHQGSRDFSYLGILEGGKELSKEVSVYVDPGVQLDSPFALTWLLTGGIRWVMP